MGGLPALAACRGQFVRHYPNKGGQAAHGTRLVRLSQPPLKSKLTDHYRLLPPACC